MQVTIVKKQSPNTVNLYLKIDIHRQYPHIDTSPVSDYTVLNKIILTLPVFGFKLFAAKPHIIYKGEYLMAMSFRDLGRIYINVPDDYDFPQEPHMRLNMMDLVYEVAKANQLGDIEPLYDPQSGKVYEGRTKSFIVRKTRQYVIGMNVFECDDENMSTIISKRQLNKLLHTFLSKKKRVSAYGLIYIYVIFTLLSGKVSSAGNCADYLLSLHGMVHSYYLNNPGDRLAAFFDQCFPLLIEAIRTQNTALDNALLPSIPRSHVKNDE